MKRCLKITSYIIKLPMWLHNISLNLIQEKKKSMHAYKHATLLHDEEKVEMCFQ
eukprot:c29270_g1_i1 orf=300-461(+)